MAKSARNDERKNDGMADRRETGNGNAKERKTVHGKFVQY